MQFTKFKLIICTVVLMKLLAPVKALAWDVVGTLPPKTHTVELGTYTAYESNAGARRYYLIDETSICGTPKLLTFPSEIFTNNIGGLYKYWKSPTGARKAYPIAFTQECQIPESEEPNNPPTQEVNFVGLQRISINPIVGDSLNDCTFIEWQVTSKNIDGTYMFNMKRIYDAAQMVNGVRSCPYQQ